MVKREDSESSDSSSCGEEVPQESGLDTVDLGFVGTVPFETVSEARRMPTEASQSSRPLFEFTLAVRALAGGPAIEETIRAVRFEFHRSFAQRVHVVTQPPFETTRSCWAENIAEIRIFFRGCRRPTVVRHLVRLRPKQDASAPPSGSALDGQPPPPVASQPPDIGGKDSTCRASTINVATIVGPSSAAVQSAVANAWRLSSSNDAILAAVQASASSLDRHIDALRAEHENLLKELARESRVQADAVAALRRRIGAAVAADTD